MKKYLLLLSCSLFVTATFGTSYAADRISAMKDIFNKEFQAMDDNKDGVLSREEYIKHQFEYFKSGLEKMDDSSLTDVSGKKSKKKTTNKKETTDSLSGLDTATVTMQEMANYTLEDDPLFSNDFNENEPMGLTKEDVMPEDDSDDYTINEPVLSDEELIAVENIDLTLSEDESLQALLADMENTEKAKAAAAEAANAAALRKEADLAAEDKQIKIMLGTIQKTLPKKIDEITTWTDITYENRMISYIYQADINTKKFSAKELSSLKKSIADEACPKAYEEMCPKIKPTFLKQGVNMQIVYTDKGGENISSCEFNNETCE